MGNMILEVEYTIDGVSCAATLIGQTVKVWIGQGLPIYEGEIEGLEIDYPKHLAKLLEIGAIKKK